MRKSTRDNIIGTIIVVGFLGGMVLVSLVLFKPSVLSSGISLEIFIEHKNKAVLDENPLNPNPDVHYSLDIAFKPMNPEVSLGRDELFHQTRVHVDADMWKAVEAGHWYQARIYTSKYSWDWRIFEIGQALKR